MVDQIINMSKELFFKKEKYYCIATKCQNIRKATMEKELSQWEKPSGIIKPKNKMKSPLPSFTVIDDAISHWSTNYI